MNSISKINFYKELIEQLKQLSQHQISIEDFNTLLVDEDKSIFKYAWGHLNKYKHSANLSEVIETIGYEHSHNPKALEILNKLLSSGLLPKRFIQDTYCLNVDKEVFYQNISSYETLVDVQNAGIDIWKMIKVKNRDLFVPLYAWDKEFNRVEVLDKCDAKKYFHLFNNNKEKWFNLDESIHSGITYLSILGEQNRKIIKDLKIKENQNNIYTNHLGQFAKISNLLLAKGLIKFVDKNNNADPLNIVRLVTSPVPQGSGYEPKYNQIKFHQKFSDLWFNYIAKTDFSYQDGFGNLVHHTFKKKKLSFYLPLKNLENKQDNFITFNSDGSKNKQSLVAWLLLLEKNNVDFYQKNIKNTSGLCSLLNWVCQREYEDSELFKSDGIIGKLWAKGTLEQKKEIVNEFMADWEHKESVLKPGFIHNYNSFHTKKNPEMIIELFLSENAINTAHTKALLDFLLPYKDKAPHMMEYCSMLQFNMLENSLDKKDTDKKFVKI